MSKSTVIFTYILLTLASLFWGTNIVFGQLAVGEISPMLLVTLRFLIVSAVVLVFYGPSLKRDGPILRAHLWYLIGLGFCGFTVFTAFFYVAAHYTPGANMAIIQGTTPFFVFSFAFLFFGQKIGPWQGLGMVLALLGVIFVASQGSWQILRQMHINFGDLCMVGATCAYSAYTVGLTKKPAGVSTMSVFAIFAMAAFVTSLPLTGYEILSHKMIWPTTKGWVLTVMIALLPSFLGQVFYIIGVQNIGPGRSGVFLNLIPVFGAVLSVIFLGEKLAWYQIAALIVVMSGIFCVQVRRRSD